MALRVRAKAAKDTTEIVLAKLKACRPKGPEGESWEVVRTSKTVLSRLRYVLSTGIQSFDDSTGGIPFGRMTELYGTEGSSKTALAMRCAIRAQQRCIVEIMPDKTTRPLPDECDVTILYIDNEQSLTDDEKIVIDGIEIDGVLARCDTVDDLFKMIDVTIDVLHDHEIASKRTQLVVVVIDTIAGTSSKEEMGAKWGKDDYARQPKALRGGFRRMIRKINRRNVAVIATNQVSDSFKPKQKSRGPTTNIPQDGDFATFGGKAVRYYARLRVFMYNLNPKYVLQKGTKFADGFLGGFTVTKNGQRPPGREGRFVLLYRGGLSNIFSMLEHLCFTKKFAERSETGLMVFHFASAGIVPTTFGVVGDETTLADDEDAEESSGKRKKKTVYSIKSRHEWPGYYANHKADIDALWAATIAWTFSGDEHDLEADAERTEVDDELALLAGGDEDEE